MGLKISSSSTSVASNLSRGSSLQLTTEASFTKLKNLILNSQEQQEAINEKKRQIDEIIRETSNFEDEAKIEAKRVEIGAHRNRYDQKLYNIRVMTQARDELLRKGEEREAEIARIESEGDDLEQQISEGERRIAVIRNIVKDRGEELVLRRRCMIRDLINLYHFDIDWKANPKAKRSMCSCFTLDFVNSVHLPYTNCLIGHSNVENEVVAAVSHVVHIVSILATILDHPLRYPVTFKPSMSTVTDNFTGQLFTLSKLRSRSERENFEKGLMLIGKNVSQIRSDCGLPCPKPERILYNLKEILGHLAGHYRITPKHHRPSHNVCSPSSMILVPKLEVNPSLEEAIDDVLDKTLQLSYGVRWRESGHQDTAEVTGSVVLSPSKRKALCVSTYSASSQNSTSPS
ncbi:hypothetical protein L596_014980 [Steinernema carpocapsae]|uniref:Uncharacterized protein n=1 Tax=Steinernema carpocapsae TaxID=34508 RepID=A0A4U5NEH3_STECR|nr:hypothetical protein L596_014980 [Steinernema carpocapsae]